MRQRVLPNILFLTLLAVSFAFLQAGTACAQTAAATAGEYGGSQLTADVLQKSLYAKTPEEEAYCVFVAEQRDKKILPNRILYSAYRYAVQKDKDRRFDYFKNALEKLSKDAHVVLKPAAETKKPANPLNIFRFSDFSWKRK